MALDEKLGRLVGNDFLRRVPEDVIMSACQRSLRLRIAIWHLFGTGLDLAAAVASRKPVATLKYE